MDQLPIICSNTNAGHFISGTVFGVLCNSTWTFKRVLTGKPSDGVVHGRAQFLFSHPHELLYQEQGKLTLTSQTPLEISQQLPLRRGQRSSLRLLLR